MYQPAAENEVYNDRMEPRVIKGQAKYTHEEWKINNPYQAPKREHFSRMKKDENAFYFPQQRRGSNSSTLSGNSSKSGKSGSTSRMQSAPKVNNTDWNHRFAREDLPPPTQIAIRRRPSQPVSVKNEPYVHEAFVSVSSSSTSPSRESTKENNIPQPFNLRNAPESSREKNRDDVSEGTPRGTPRTPGALSAALSGASDGASDGPSGGILFRSPGRSSEPVILSPGRVGGRVPREQDHLAIQSYLDKVDRTNKNDYNSRADKDYRIVRNKNDKNDENEKNSGNDGNRIERTSRATSPMPVDSFLSQRFGVKGWSGGIFRENQPVPNTCRTSRDSTDGRSPLIWHVSRNGLGRVSRSVSPRQSLERSYERKEGFNPNISHNTYILNTPHIPHSPRKGVSDNIKHTNGNSGNNVKSKGKSVTRSTSPIDERVIRLVLGGSGDSADFEPLDSRYSNNPSSYNGFNAPSNKKNFPGQALSSPRNSDRADPIQALAGLAGLPGFGGESGLTGVSGVPVQSQESVMASMARVMEAVEKIVRGQKQEKNIRKGNKNTKNDRKGSNRNEMSDKSSMGDKMEPQQTVVDPGSRSGESKNDDSKERNEERKRVPFIGKKAQVLDLILSKIQAMEQRENEINQFLLDPSARTHPVHTAFTPHHVTFEHHNDNNNDKTERLLRSVPASSIPDSRLLSAPSSSSVPSSSSGAGSGFTVRYDPHSTGNSNISSGSGNSGGSSGGRGNSNGNRGSVYRTDNSVRDQWQSPTTLDNNETALSGLLSVPLSGPQSGPLSVPFGSGVQESGGQIAGLVSFQPPKQPFRKGGKGEFHKDEKDIAAIERQQYALDQLPRLTPTVELQREMREYKRELAIARDMREAPFKDRGLTLSETIEKYADAIAYELSDEAAGEIEEFVDQYAERFIGQI